MLGKENPVGATEVLLLLFAEDTVKSYKIYGLGNHFSIKGLDGGLIINGGKNIALQIWSNTKKEPTVWRVFFMFLKTEGEVTQLWEKLFGWRVINYLLLKIERVHY